MPPLSDNSLLLYTFYILLVVFSSAYAFPSHRKSLGSDYFRRLLPLSPPPADGGLTYNLCNRATIAAKTNDGLDNAVRACSLATHRWTPGAKQEHPPLKQNNRTKPPSKRAESRCWTRTLQFTQMHLNGQFTRIPLLLCSGAQSLAFFGSIFSQAQIWLATPSPIINIYLSCTMPVIARIAEAF